MLWHCITSQLHPVIGNATSTRQSSATPVGPLAPAGATPTSADQTVTIMAGTVVRITTGATIDEVVLAQAEL